MLSLTQVTAIEGEEDRIDTHLINNFSDESIPFTGRRVFRAVLAVWDQIELVLEAQHITDRLQQINTETLQLLVRVTVVLEFCLLHYIRHRLYGRHPQCYVGGSKLVEGLVVCDVHTRRSGPLSHLSCFHCLLIILVTGRTDLVHLLLP